ncbi:hypothetical protein COLO4_18831 [Corchorus olitorius]|uniref:Sulfotransferase n=1 Tax=Corchorus olitorius TaxID=93759 RepID=A0A1R3J7S6_9ROSI|nr:hypothetical protein COLO4_18831 [Corchorus olitorius]
MEKMKHIIESLPNETGWSLYQPYCLYQGFWCFPDFLEGIMLAQECFKPEPGDIFICSHPKSGTTWLKALTFAIINRHRYHFDDSSNPLLSKGPHDCVFFLEQRKFIGKFRQPGVPLIATHTPYSSLPKSVLDSDDCKIVYICRDPKDTFVSLFHFIDKRRPKHIEPVSIEQGFELFCEGKSIFGPIWDHILGYWKASLERPNKVMFLKYEDMRKDSALYVKKLGEFMGYSFSAEEQHNVTLQKIVELCSFENLRGLEVNKTGVQVNRIVPHPVANQDYFRKGKVGDWSNYLTPEMAQRLDKIMERKFYGSGLTFKN